MSPTAQANLLTNGSFETGAFVSQGGDTMSVAVGSTAIDGWTVATDTTAWIGPANPFALSASDGGYFLDLTNYEGGAPYSGMQQTIATVVGATYALSFDLGASNIYGRPVSLMASAAGSAATFTTPVAGTNNDWYRHSMQFVADSTTTTILLQGASGLHYIGLDNVSVDLVSLPVPEPGTWALVGLGVAGLAAIRRIRAAQR